MKVAILDDWQNVARTSAGWSELERRAELVFRSEPFASEDEAAGFLADAGIIFAMRERTPFPASLIRRLPELRMFSMGGNRGAKIDIAEMNARGIAVCGTVGGPSGASTAELALGLMLSAARSLPASDANIRAGRFQEGIPPGSLLEGKRLGLLGLGRIGAAMARYGAALGMKVAAWSPNLTAERAAAGGAELAAKDALFESSDVISLHLVLSGGTRRIVDAAALGRMKPGAILVNTARSGLIDTGALLEVLREGRITAALDVYDIEPLPRQDAFRSLPNTVLAPHLGYSVREVYEAFYTGMVENALAFLDGRPIRLLGDD